MMSPSLERRMEHVRQHVFDLQQLAIQGSPELQANLQGLSKELDTLTEQVQSEVNARDVLEQAVREGEEGRRALMERAGKVIYTVDEQGVLFWISPTIEPLTGLTPSEVVGRPLSELVHPQDRSRVIEDFEHLLSGHAAIYEVRLLTETGDVRWARASSRALLDGDRVIGVEGVLTDITQQKVADEALREREERFRCLTEVAFEGVAVTEDGRFIEVSDRFAALFGYNGEELIGHSAEMLIAPEARDDVMTKILAGYAQPYESLYVRRDGSLFPVEVCGKNYHHKGGNRRITAMRDISAQKQAEEELTKHRERLEQLVQERTAELAAANERLRQAVAAKARAVEKAGEREAMLQAFLDATTESAIMVDLDGAVLVANKVAAHRLGKSVRTLVGLEIEAYLPRDLAEARKSHGVEVARLGKPCRFQDERAGRTFDNRIYPAFDPEGSVMALAIFSQDITERKQAEDALQYRVELERLIAAISTHFVNLAAHEVDAAIDQALQAIGEFVGADRSYVFLFSDEGSRMDNTHEWCGVGIEPQMENLQGLPSHDFPWWMEKLNRFQNIYIPSVANLPPEATAEKEILESQGIRSLIVVPLTHSGTLVGFLGFDSVQVKKLWLEEDITLLKTVGDVLVQALKRAQVERAVHGLTEELRALNAIATASNQTLVLEEVLPIVLGETLRALGVEGGMISLFDDVSQAFIPACHQGLSQRVLRELAGFKSGEGLSGQVAVSGEPLIVADLRKDLGMISSAATQSEWRSYAGVPLKLKDEMLGVMALVTRRAGYLIPNRLDLLAHVGNLVGMAVSNAQLYKTEHQRSAELLRSTTLMAGLSQVAAHIRTTLDPHNVMETVGAELERIGIHCIVGLLDPRGEEVVVRYVSLEPTMVTCFEKLTDLTALDIRFRPERLVHHNELVVQKRAVFEPDSERLVTTHLPDLPRVLSEDLLRETGLGAGIGVTLLPLVTEELLRGILMVWGQDLRESDIAALSVFATQVAVALENARLFSEVHQSRQQLQILSRQLVKTQEDERRYIAQELHDEIGQALTMIKINLQAIERGHIEATSVPYLEESVRTVVHVLEQVRNLTLDLRPPLLDDLGLVPALRGYVDRQARQAGLSARVIAEVPDAHLSPDLQITCFRIVQEALNNIVRHAQAENVRVELRKREDELEVTVSDDGVGFDVELALKRATHGASLGLLGMQERSAFMRGGIEIESVPGHGTKVRARFPLGYAVQPEG
jgi:PAS domain S-box-containing protein